MDKVKFIHKGGLPGFIVIQMGHEFILKCESCCKAWAMPIPASGLAKDGNKLTLYNVTLHRKVHVSPKVKRLLRKVRQQDKKRAKESVSQ